MPTVTRMKLGGYVSSFLGVAVLAGAVGAPAQGAARTVPKGALALEVFRGPITRETRLTAAERLRLRGPGFAGTWEQIGGAVVSQARSVGGSNFIAVPGRVGVAIFQLSAVGESRRAVKMTGYGPGGSVLGFYPLKIGTTPFGIMNIGTETSDFLMFAPSRVRSLTIGGRVRRPVGGAFVGTFATQNPEDVFGALRAAL